jgi:putative addiction module killer protein
MVEIRIYTDENGKAPYLDWLRKIDSQAQSRIRIAIDRLEGGNTGSLKSVGGGVSEIKITFGPAYRIYIGQQGNELVILLHGGTKQRQSDDIAKAKELWRNYLDETKNERKG